MESWLQIEINLNSLSICIMHTISANTYIAPYQKGNKYIVRSIVNG